MKSTLAALSFAVFASTSALAAPDTYVIEPTHTYPHFSYNHLGFSVQQSRFNKTSGKIVYDRAARQGSVDIVIDMASVDTGSDTFDEHLRGPDYFDTARFPTATFKSTRIVFNGDKPASIEGQLTIKGITRPVTLTVNAFQAMPHPMLRKDTIGANAYTMIKRSEFNAGKYVPFVGDDVRIDVAIEALKE